MRSALLSCTLILATTACGTVSKIALRRTPQDVPASAEIEAPDPEPEQPDEPKAGVGIEAGDTSWSIRAHYGVPILQKSLFWNGLGEVDDWGLGFHGYWLPFDGILLGAGFNPTHYMTPGHDVFGFEFEAMSRWYLLSYDDARLFFDWTLGWLQSTHGIPPGGTEWNMTFGFGPGVDLPLDEGISLLIAANYHHKSNALGKQNPHNPSQNEVRFWIGFASDW